MTPEELIRIENEVNDVILDGLNITVTEMGIDEAKAIGATALFGEKYGDVVRVVKMGDYSMELCGGTHIDNTAKVGPFRIMSECSVASGVRRIEAVTGKEYLRMTNEASAKLAKVTEMLKTKPNELLSRTESVMGEVRELRQTVDKLKDKLLCGDVERFLFAAKNIGGLNVITVTRTDLDSNDLRKLGDFLRDKDPKIVAVLATATEQKVTFVASCGKEANAAGVKAGELIRSVCTVAGGKGGGKPDSAMGGGKDVLKVDDALAQVDDFVASKL